MAQTFAFCPLQSQLRDPCLILCILDLGLGNMCFDRKLHDWTNGSPVSSHLGNVQCSGNHPCQNDILNNSIGDPEMTME